MTEKQQVIDLGSSCEFTEQPDGTVIVRFADFELEATGTDNEEAFKNLIGVLGQRTQADPELAERFNAWAADHIVEREVPEDEAREQRMVEQAAQEAGHAFTELNDTSFETAITTEGALLVDFWAPWCKPCLMLAPVLVEIHEDLNKRFDIAKVNVDDYPALSDRFGIRGIPCMIVFHKGEEVGRIVGMGPKYAITDQITEILEKVSPSS